MHKKSRPKYPTRLSAKVLTSRITVYFIFIFFMPFSLWAQSSWYWSSENFWPINRLATTGHFPLNKAGNIEDFFQPASDKPGPDHSLHIRYPTRHRFSLFIPPLRVSTSIIIQICAERVHSIYCFPLPYRKKIFIG